MRFSASAALLAASCATLPAGDEPARSLAAAETAFAAHSVREDMRAAFLAAFAPDGVFVRGAWTAARPWLEPRAAPPIVLDWRPVHVEAARSGEMGLSTGPWRITPKGRAEATGFGQFVSIWTREPGGPWRVAVDIGISHPQPTLWDAPLDARVSPGVAATSPLAAAEKAFSEMAAREGTGAALARWAATDVRAYREGRAPLLGRDAVLRDLAGEPTASWHADALRTAASGELGWARGTLAAAGIPVQGYYLHVWRHESAGWRLVLDVVNPAKR